MSEIQQKTKKPLHKKWWVWVLLIIVIFVFIGSLGGGKKEGEKIGMVNTSSTATTTASTAQSSSVVLDSYNLGDLVKVDKFEFSVLSVKETKSDNPYIKPKEGNKYMTVELQIKNNGDTKEVVSTLMNFYLKNSDGEKGTQALMTGDKSVDGELLKGDKIKGTITYEISKNSSGLKFYYNPSFLFGKSIVVKLD